MRLRVAFIRYGNDETLMPNVLVATDEYMEDAHGGLPPFWFSALDEASGDDEVRVCFVEVSDKDVTRLFDAPTIAGYVR